MWKFEFQQPKQIAAANDPDIKTEITGNTLLMKAGVLEKLEKLISSWIKMARVVA